MEKITATEFSLESPFVSIFHQEKLDTVQGTFLNLCRNAPSFFLPSHALPAVLDIEKGLMHPLKNHEYVLIFRKPEIR